MCLNLRIELLVFHLRCETLSELLSETRILMRSEATEASELLTPLRS
jgi:hypothetical protein